MQNIDSKTLEGIVNRGEVEYGFFVNKNVSNLIFPKLGDISSFVFHGARFRNVFFFNIDFGGADLTEAVFEYCGFFHCSMIKTLQYQTSFSKCSLHNLNFKNARLNSVKFTDCIIGKSSFEGAIVAESTFTRCILSGKFNGRSSVNTRSVDTIGDWFPETN